jgi:hypothetical protein
MFMRVDNDTLFTIQQMPYNTRLLKIPTTDSELHVWN